MSDDMDLVPDEQFDLAMDRMAREEALLMKPSKVLRTAADLLEKGWCQGSLGVRVHHVPEYGAVVTMPINVTAFKAGAEIDRVCLMGALMKAVVDLYGADWPVDETRGVIPYEDRTPIERAMTMTYLNSEVAVEREIARRTGLTGPILAAVWNDSAGRSKAEVLDVVRATAARAEEAGR